MKPKTQQRLTLLHNRIDAALQEAASLTEDQPAHAFLFLSTLNDTGNVLSLCAGNMRRLGQLLLTWGACHPASAAAIQLAATELAGRDKAATNNPVPN